jgi:hypothetical protein
MKKNLMIYIYNKYDLSELCILIIHYNIFNQEIFLDQIWH